MISVSPARSAEDFEIAARLARGLADWDIVAVQSYGISAEDVVSIFHPGTGADILAARFGATDASFLIARWEGAPAGCAAFSPFDDDTTEIHKFFVDAQFRGKGIGRALMDIALAEIGKGHRRKVVLHTTPYMESAVAIYESFGFRPCSRFRETPEHVRHTDLFMSRSLTA
jgi:ribosomal protein S18 acetylase RimI-like enzyme